MAIYAIGDLQGCYEPLRALLDQLAFDPAHDQLWLTGDLVNRGPHSLATLRFVRGLGAAAITVLGNHDLHLLALAERPTRSLLRKRSGLNDLLQAADAEELVAWLRHRPLMHYDRERDVALVHAGILPQWSIKKALARAAEVEQTLRGPGYRPLMKHLYGNKPALWDAALTGTTRLRFIINAFTRMRMLTRRGGLDLTSSGPPNAAPGNRTPWFAARHKRGDTTVIFGHWSALGFYRGDGVIALDTGCVWGRQLTAVRIDAPDAMPCCVECAGVVER